MLTLVYIYLAVTLLLTLFVCKVSRETSLLVRVLASVIFGAFWPIAAPLLLWHGVKFAMTMIAKDTSDAWAALEIVKQWRQQRSAVSALDGPVAKVKIDHRHRLLLFSLLEPTVD